MVPLQPLEGDEDAIIEGSPPTALSGKRRRVYELIKSLLEQAHKRGVVRSGKHSKGTDPVRAALAASGLSLGA